MSERPPPIPPPGEHPRNASPSEGAPRPVGVLDGLRSIRIVGSPEIDRPRPLSLPISLANAPSRDARRARVAEALERTREEKARSAAEDGRTSQGSLLVMPTVREGHLDALLGLLESIANPPGGEDLEINPVIPFLRLRTVHFARFLVHHPSPSEEAPIPEWNGRPQARGPEIPAKLLFSTDFDGPLDEHLHELLDVAGPGLDQIFGHCEGWPGPVDRAAAVGYLMLNRVRTSAFYTGTMGRSVDQIRREAELRTRIEDFLDLEGRRAAFPSDPLALRDRIVEFVREEEDLDWTRVRPGPLPKLLIPEWLVRRPPLAAALALVALLGAATAVLALLLPWMQAVAWVIGSAAVIGGVATGAFEYLSRLAATDPVIIRDGVKEHTAKLVRTEDRIVQNEMSSVIYVKEPLWFRGAVLRVVLAFVNFAARYLSNQGALAGIPSIHFARWVMVDGGRRLEFFSNFDGSWENYLGDFIDKAAPGLTAVWSNCVGFPRTRGLTGAGATDEQKFKAYSRASQIPTQVWYSAYKWLSVDNINNNSRIRLGLYGEMERAEAAAWLRRF